MALGLLISWSALSRRCDIVVVDSVAPYPQGLNRGEMG